LINQSSFAIAYTLTHLMQVIVAGAPDAPETQVLLAAAHGSFAPDRLILPIDPANQASKVWYQQHNPEAWAMIEGATKEVCISLMGRVHFPCGQSAFSLWAKSMLGHKDELLMLCINVCLLLWLVVERASKGILVVVSERTIFASYGLKASSASGLRPLGCSTMNRACMWVTAVYM